MHPQSKRFLCLKHVCNQFGILLAIVFMFTREVTVLYISFCLFSVGPVDLGGDLGKQIRTRSRHLVRFNTVCIKDRNIGKKIIKK